MDIHSVRIEQKDIDRVLARAAPAEPAGLVGDACQVYRTARPTLEIAITLLTTLYPRGARALAAVVAIVDVACGGPAA